MMLEIQISWKCLNCDHVDVLPVEQKHDGVSELRSLEEYVTAKIRTMTLCR